MANLIASLEKQGCNQEAERLVSDSIQKLKFKEQDVALFYCNLIESFSRIGCKESVFDYYSRVKQILPESNRRRAFEAMISALCTLDSPIEAEEILEEMILLGIKPSKFDFRLIVLAYGRLGLFHHMRRVLDQLESSGYNLDTICFNIVLSCYGSHGELSEMVTWIREMKNAHTPFSVRTYNTVLNSCPTVISLLQDIDSLPLSVGELMKKMEGDEAVLIEELMASSVLGEIFEWSSSEGKVDLHGMHLGAVYVVVLQWIEELRSRFRDENAVIPAEIVMVCGLGKHSNVRGESPVKALVSGMMVRLESPMRIDRKNIGCFVAKGKNVRNWLRSVEA